MLFLMLFLTLSACTGGLSNPPEKVNSMPDPADRPISTITRGDAALHTWVRSTGFHSENLWCTLQWRGQDIILPGRASACSLSPAPSPSVATVVMRTEEHRGLYHIVLGSSPTNITHLSNEPLLDGAWTLDETYVRPNERITASGLRQPIAPWQGKFLAVSPTGDAVLSLTQPTPETVIVHLTSTQGGEVRSASVIRKQHPWLTDNTHVVEGSPGSAHLVKSAHISWTPSDGGWEVRLDDQPLAW